MKKIIITSVILLSTFFSFAQGVAINANGAAPAADATLDVSSTDKGMLVPRIALTATNVSAPVNAPTTSLLIYNTATAGITPNNVTPGFYYWGGVQWIKFSENVAGSISLPIDIVTTSFTLDSTHYSIILNPTAPITLTLPSPADAPGRIYTFTNRNFHLVTFASTTYITASGTGTDVSGFGTLKLQSDGINWYKIP